MITYTFQKQYNKYSKVIRSEGYRIVRTSILRDLILKEMEVVLN